MTGPVSTWMGDRLWAGIPSQYITSQLGQLSLDKVIAKTKIGLLLSRYSCLMQMMAVDVFCKCQWNEQMWHLWLLYCLISCNIWIMYVRSFCRSDCWPLRLTMQCYNECNAHTSGCFLLFCGIGLFTDGRPTTDRCFWLDWRYNT